MLYEVCVHFSCTLIELPSLMKFGKEWWHPQCGLRTRCRLMNAVEVGDPSLIPCSQWIILNLFACFHSCEYNLGCPACMFVCCISRKDPLSVHKAWVGAISGVKWYAKFFKLFLQRFRLYHNQITFVGRSMSSLHENYIISLGQGSREQGGRHKVRHTQPNFWSNKLIRKTYTSRMPTFKVAY